MSSVPPVAGSWTSKRAPPLPSRHVPPMSSLVGTASMSDFWGDGHGLLRVAIRCAELSGATGEVIAKVPHRVGCKGQDGFETLSLRLPGKSNSTLTIRYSNAELAVIRADKRLFTQLAMVIGLLVAGLASWIGFRTIIGHPIGLLLSAIQKSAANEVGAVAAHPPNDELGLVISAFNEMQIKLKNESQRNLRALKSFDHLYNETPALMFTICSAEHIASVSGHWLEQTGYARTEVIGKPLSTFVRRPEESSRDSHQRFVGEARRDVPCLLVRKDGTTKDVLLSSISSHIHVGDVEEQTCYLCVMSDVSGLVAARRTLRAQTITDHLTRLPNRQALFEHLANFSKLPSDALRDAAILFIDLDNFKWVNDTHGHAVGDALLRAAAARISNCIGATDFMARLGGDEFAVVLHGLIESDGALRMAERIRAQLTLPFQIGDLHTVVSCSVGIADGELNIETPQELLQLADLAMYKSKQDGRNRITFYTNELGRQAAAREKMVKRIRTGLSDARFRLFCQPIVDLKTMKPAGFEALLRLQCPKEGIVGPAEIIRTAEETGLMGQIGRWVLEEGMAIGGQWQNAGRTQYVSINLSPRQLDGSFMGELVGRLRDDPHIARNLVFEITESALLTNADRIGQFFADVRASGARIALDDFGTGYSSLHYISRFQVDFIKLDRSFIHQLDDPGLPTTKRNMALVKSTATLCKDLNISLVAEGIETQQQLELLRNIGIDYGQGYVFAPPLPEAKIVDWMSRFDRSFRATPELALSA